MQLKYFLAGATLIVLLAFQACAGNNGLATGAEYARIIESYSQRTLPGTRETPPQTQYSFTLQWHHQDQPQQFFWKTDGRWWSSAVTSSDGSTRKAAGDINKDDSFTLVSQRVTTENIPTGIPDHLNNIIVFKTNKSGWQYLEVKTITRRPDIVMP